MKKLSLLLAAVLLLTAFAGCGKKVEGEASVQSVAMICGLGSTGRAERFAGVVSARSETEIKKDEDKVVDEILVAEGDNVTAGQVLFTYDMQQVELNLEKGQLELEQLRNTKTAKETEKAQLEADKAKAPASEQLSYTLEIQEADTAIREAEYNISLKEKEVQKLAEALDHLEVTSPVDGRVQSLNEDGATDNYGNPLPFMSVMETGTYRIKGYLNENNAGSLFEGTPVVIRSRRDGTLTWSGSVSKIDWESPTQDNGSNGMYAMADTGAEGEMTNTTKYPFYIELDDAEGLMLGQHVYIEPDYGQDAEAADDLIRLPSYFISDADSDAWVWAENARGLLEKRSITLGEYDEMMDTYLVESGLTAEDYIAFPEETLQAGMTCVEYDENTFGTGDMAADGGYDEGYVEEGDFAGEGYVEEGDFAGEGYVEEGDFAEAMPAETEGVG